jgi:multicomponent Na+:H+ antiporter subunit E
MMSLLALNALMTLCWCALTGSFAPANVALGAALGYLALWVARPLQPETSYFSKPASLIGLLLFFFYELFVSSLQVAWDVLTPKLRAKPDIVDVPLDLDDDRAITVLAILVSLTPGTLALDVSEDRRTLLVHAMFADDPDEVRRSIKDGLERRVGAVFAR